MSFIHTYEELISLDNLLEAWKNFVRGKRGKKDVQKFQQNLMYHLIELHKNLSDKTYAHSKYQAFNITDPKPRKIHKASVRDRVLHHAIYRVLYHYFDKRFIPNSFSCRLGKGTHKGFESLEKMIRKESKNYTKQCFVLKCDIKKFFNSIDHNILLTVLKSHIDDEDVLELLKKIIYGFGPPRETLFSGKGLPLGNLTSQLFANVYMNEFDQFVKHKLKIKHYVRYTDDFVFIHHDKEYFERLLPKVEDFLLGKLSLSIHPNKVVVTTAYRGVDFLGYVARPHYRVLRTKTKKRMFNSLRKKAREYRDGDIEYKSLEQSLNSCLGALLHANSYYVSEDLKNKSRFWLNNGN